MMVSQHSTMVAYTYPFLKASNIGPGRQAFESGFLAFRSYNPNTESAGLSAFYQNGQELFEQYCKFMNRVSSFKKPIPGKDMCRHRLVPC